MKNILSTVILSAALACVTAFAADAKPAAAEKPIKIGVILPLTGNMAQVGRPQLAAVELFKAECAKGNYKHKYEVIVEDDAMTGRMTAEAAVKLFNIDHVDGIITLFSPSANVIAPRARASGVPHLSISSDPKVADNRVNFLHWAMPETEAVECAKLIKKLGGTRVVGITTRAQGTMAIINDLKPELKKLGITEFSNIYINSGERDFRTTLLKIRETHPDFLLPFTFSPELEILLRQRKQIGLNVKMASIECPDFLDYSADAEGLFYITGGWGTPEFNKRILSATGKSSGYAVAYTYDCLNILRSAYETLDTPDHATAAKYISQLKDFPSALGSVSMRPDGRIESPASLFRIVNGKPTPAKWEDVK